MPECAVSRKGGESRKRCLCSKARFVGVFSILPTEGEPKALPAPLLNLLIFSCFFYRHRSRMGYTCFQIIVRSLELAIFVYV